MGNFNPIYRKFIDDRNAIKSINMVRGKFYLIQEYIYADGTKERFSETSAPIIFVLFTSKSKDIVHAVKVTNINPNLIKKFFAKFIHKETEKLALKGSSKAIYEKIVSKVPIITSEAYRTYIMSGITKVIELKMDVNELTPKNIKVIGIEKSSQKKNV